MRGVTAIQDRGSGTLRGRERELAELDALVRRARAGRSGVLVVTGEAGVGKTALLDVIAARAAANVRVERIAASESEMELAYAGLQQLCAHMMGAAQHLPEPQRDALEIALGIRQGAPPSPLLVGLAVLGVMTDAADDRALLCIIDDAQWLDEASRRAVAFVARRLDVEGIAIVLAVRVVGEPFADLPRLVVGGLGDDDARALLNLALPATIDTRVRDQLIAESRGNPLALRELPRALSPAEIAGGFALAGRMPLESRIEQSLIRQLGDLPPATRLLLLVAAADPTGDPGLLWGASKALGLGMENVDSAESANALVVGARVGFRHPLVRSAVYRAASPADRRRVHAALAEVTLEDRDPDRRAWHRASATLGPDEDVAADLVRSAARARTRGGAAAAAAFLERAAELTPAPVDRRQRLIEAAEAKLDAGAPGASLRLLDTARDHPATDLQEALVGRLRARADYALRRHRGGPRELLAAAQRLAPFDAVLARDTYMAALAAAMFAGRLGEPGVVEEVARQIVAATADDDSEHALDLTLRGQALLAAEGPEAAFPTLRRAVRALLDADPDPFVLRWMWFGCRAAIDMWDADGLRELADRQVELARAAGVVTVLPVALTYVMAGRLLDGRLDAFEVACDEVDAIKNATGNPLPRYGRIIVAAYRGRIDEVERRAREFTQEAQASGEGTALSAIASSAAIAYNSAGRYDDALSAARPELDHVHELSFAMRAMPEIVEAAIRTGDRKLAEQALAALRPVTTLAGTDWALGTRALTEAQLREGAHAAALHAEAVERFARGRMPLLEGRARLLYGEWLRREHRRLDARVQLRAAHELLTRCGAAAFAERAARELSATGETLRVRTLGAVEQLTDQELNVARLARDGLTNRDIGARLFISARTAEYHLRKVFIKLGIRGRAELKAALADLD
jgi:DNA-binding CsgD family transcriptional regulator